MNIQKACEILEQMLREDIEIKRFSLKEFMAINTVLFEITLTGQYVLPEKFFVPEGDKE